MTPDLHLESEVSPTLGARLRLAREASGLTVERIAASLRIPVALVEAIERDDFGRLGAPVFVRGHLMAYARLAGVPAADVEASLQQRVASAPQLVALAPSTRLQRFADRAAKRAVYLVLTGAIVLPVVWYATQPGSPGARVALDPLDPPAMPLTARSVPAERGDPGRTVEPRKEYPIVASLAPFYTKSSSDGQPADEVEAEPRSADGAFSIHLRAASWVEIYGADGQKLEQALLPAGSERHYAAGQVGRVTLGNADAVVVRKAGQEVDVSAFRRANVARFAISSDGSLRPAGG